MSCKCSEDSVNFTYAVSYRIRNSKPFTKVTSPLGSRAFSVWVRVPSGAPKPPRRLLLYGRRGGFFFAMHPPADRARSPRFQLRCAERKLVARQAGIAQNELVFVLALHSGLLLDRHGVSALLQHPPDEHIRAVDPVKGRDQVHARSTAADVYRRQSVRSSRRALYSFFMRRVCRSSSPSRKNAASAS